MEGLVELVMIKAEGDLNNFVTNLLQGDTGKGTGFDNEDAYILIGAS